MNVGRFVNSFITVLPSRLRHCVTFGKVNKCWVHRGDHRILALRHKILLLMIEGLTKRDGAEVSPRARDDALTRKRTNVATFTNLIYPHFIFTSHYRACQDSLIYPSTYYLLPRPTTLTRLVTMLARLVMALARLVMTLTRLSRHAESRL